MYIVRTAMGTGSKEMAGIGRLLITTGNNKPYRTSTGSNRCRKEAQCVHRTFKCPAAVVVAALGEAVAEGIDNMCSYSVFISGEWGACRHFILSCLACS
jgi:hypothetical protein